MVDVRAVRKQHIGKDKPVFVSAVNLQGDLLSEHQDRDRLFGVVAERLALLRVVNAMRADALIFPIVQDFNRILIPNANNFGRGS